MLGPPAGLTAHTSAFFLSSNTYLLRPVRSTSLAPGGGQLGLHVEVSGRTLSAVHCGLKAPQEPAPPRAGHVAAA